MESRKSYSNAEMDRMIASLEKHLERRDKIGYAAARNTRILRSTISEYLTRKDELVQKYGEEITKDGIATGAYQIEVGTKAFFDYSQEIDEYARIEHSPQIFKISVDEAIGELSGAEILELDWMLKDEEVDNANA